MNTLDAALAAAVARGESAAQRSAAVGTEDCQLRGIEAFLAAELFCNECVTHTHTHELMNPPPLPTTTKK
jgi:hypothetical protein